MHSPSMQLLLLLEDNFSALYLSLKLSTLVHISLMLKNVLYLIGALPSRSESETLKLLN